MSIVAFQDIIDCNHMLEEKGLTFRVHLRDSCGGQSMWIEPLNSETCEGKFSEMREVISEYFIKKNMKIQFDQSGLSIMINK